MIEPFVEYFRRDGALLFLAFILLYKLGDSMASAITGEIMYVDCGFNIIGMFLDQEEPSAETAPAI